MSIHLKRGISYVIDPRCHRAREGQSADLRKEWGYGTGSFPLWHLLVDHRNLQLVSQVSVQRVE